MIVVAVSLIPHLGQFHGLRITALGALPTSCQGAANEHLHRFLVRYVPLELYLYSFMFSFLSDFVDGYVLR